MKAAYLEKQNQPLIIDDLKLPNLNWGQVLVKVKYSGICGRQIQEINGSKGEDKFLPHLMGHEGGGVVLKVGEGVNHVKVNDNVVMHWRPGFGIDSNFPKYENFDGLSIGGGLVTTFNEEAVVSGNRITKIDNSIPLEFAALLGCSTSTALGIIINEAQVRPGNSLLIIGSGGVGLNLVQVAKMINAYPIITVDNNINKLKYSKKIGASHTINTREIELEDGIKSILGNSSTIDFAVDTTGSTNLISTAYDIIGKNGQLILVGQPKINEDLVLKNVSKNFLGKKIFDSQGGLFHPHLDIPKLSILLKNNVLDLSGIITDTFDFMDVNLAINKLIKGEIIGKCILKFN